MSDRVTEGDVPAASSVPIIEATSDWIEDFYVRRRYCPRCHGCGSIEVDFDHKWDRPVRGKCPECNGVGYSEERTRLSDTETVAVRAAIDWDSEALPTRR